MKNTFIKISPTLVVRIDQIRYAYQDQNKDQKWQIRLSLDGALDPFSAMMMPKVTFDSYDECTEQMAKVTKALLQCNI